MKGGNLHGGRVARCDDDGGDGGGGIADVHELAAV